MVDRAPTIMILSQGFIVLFNFSLKKAIYAPTYIIVQQQLLIGLF